MDASRLTVLFSLAFSFLPRPPAEWSSAVEPPFRSEMEKDGKGFAYLLEGDPFPMDTWMLCEEIEKKNLAVPEAVRWTLFERFEYDDLVFLGVVLGSRGCGKLLVKRPG